VAGNNPGGILLVATNKVDA
jgi:L-lactate dehydrogenase